MDKIIELPGLIDPHVHLRDPWQSEKEDFYTGTSAALAGGIVAVCDMPNNQEHIVSEKLLDQKIISAKQKAVCDIGFYFSALSPETIGQFGAIYDKVVGIKLFVTKTTNMDTQKGLGNIDELTKVFDAWQSKKPILLHAEDESVAVGIEAVKRTNRKTHFCHISSMEELKPILQAKSAGLPISCGVTPHHLFLSEKDLAQLGSLGNVKPSLKPKTDQQFLWDNLNAIDLIESDHAPHTLEQKNLQTTYGMPGLETILPLLLTAEAKGKITRAEIIDKLHMQPARLIGYEPDPETKIEVSMEEYEISNSTLLTKSAWSPFAGRKVLGKVVKVYLRGTLVFENGKVLAKPGSGTILN